MSRRGSWLNYPWKRRVWHERNLAPLAPQISVEEIEETSVAKQRPAHGQIDETLGSRPFKTLQTVAQAQHDRRVMISHDRAADWMCLPLGGSLQINCQCSSQGQRKDRIVRPTIDTAIDKPRTEGPKCTDRHNRT